MSFLLRQAVVLQRILGNSPEEVKRLEDNG